MAEGAFLEGAVRFPDELPCPHADTDLTPRERRYISDIGEVKKLRRFQSTFQATRQNISFIFTPEQSRRFREWYKYDIIEGGAWFYADWPILHREKDIAYRFVTRPVWEFLARGNYHVSATVELYERKVGKTANVFTSKLYPLLPVDDTKLSVPNFRRPPFYAYSDNAGVAVPTFTGVLSGKTEVTLTVDDLEIPEVLLFGTALGRIFDQHFTLDHPRLSGDATIYTYGELYTDDQAKITIPQFTGVFTKWVITYDYYNEDAATITVPTITAGVLT